MAAKDASVLKNKQRWDHGFRLRQVQQYPQAGDAGLWLAGWFLGRAMMLRPGPVDVHSESPMTRNADRFRRCRYTVPDRLSPQENLPEAEE
jgi:hypothetical protein